VTLPISRWTDSTSVQVEPVSPSHFPREPWSPRSRTGFSVAGGHVLIELLPPISSQTAIPSALAWKKEILDIKTALLHRIARSFFLYYVHIFSENITECCCIFEEFVPRSTITVETSTTSAHSAVAFFGSWLPILLRFALNQRCVRAIASMRSLWASPFL
jgi:hypothetical protein